MLVQGIYPTFFVSSSRFQQHFSFKSLMRNIADIHVSIWFIYNPSIKLSKGGNNIQHSMLYFHNKNTASQKKQSMEYCEHLCQHLQELTIVLEPDAYMEDTSNIICQIFQYYVQKYHHEAFHIFLALLVIFMMNILTFMLALQGIFQDITIHWCKESSQHRAHPVFNNISIYTYQQYQWRHLCQQMVYIHPFH